VFLQALRYFSISGNISELLAQDPFSIGRYPTMDVWVKLKDSGIVSLEPPDFALFESHT
jgi:hypothetical protein